MGAASADPLGEETTPHREVVPVRNAVHHGAVPPVAVQEPQNVLPVRHRADVPELLRRDTALRSVRQPHAALVRAFDDPAAFHERREDRNLLR